MLCAAGREGSFADAGRRVEKRRLRRDLSTSASIPVITTWRLKQGASRFSAMATGNHDRRGTSASGRRFTVWRRSRASHALGARALPTGGRGGSPEWWCTRMLPVPGGCCAIQAGAGTEAKPPASDSPRGVRWIAAAPPLGRAATRGSIPAKRR